MLVLAGPLRMLCNGYALSYDFERTLPKKIAPRSSQVSHCLNVFHPCCLKDVPTKAFITMFIEPATLMYALPRLLSKFFHFLFPTGMLPL